jgi:hypothetical protein
MPVRACLVGATLAAALSVACSSAPPAHHDEPAGDGGGSTPTSPSGTIVEYKKQPPTDLGASCNPSRSVQSDGPALLVRDPDVLSRFPLDRVLGQIISTAGAAVTPTELLQRLFDTENSGATSVFADSVNCDDASNGSFFNANAVDCPRAEGRLAESAGLFVPGDPDYFVPVALVNRFDLMPDDFSSCGEYRIVYAKQSGRNDPENRVFLILEGALVNPKGTLAGCRPVAELWASLENPPSVLSLADRVEKFYFEGLDGFAPVVHANHYGLNQFDCTYSGKCGQLRMGQGMQAPWELRQFRLQKPLADAAGPSLHFAPTPDTRSPRPELFDTAVNGGLGDAFRAFFLEQFPSVANVEVARLSMASLAEYDAFQSALEGPAQPNYMARATQGKAGATFAEQIAQRLDRLDPAACPSEDPMTQESILQRATALTCAGCHAPERLLSPERKIGCGQVWPKSLGEAHIDEQGKLSEALTQVFLPHRASVMGTYLQACDEAAIRKNLQPVPVQSFPECFVAGTPVTMANGSGKAIEQIVPGEVVLTLDLESRALVAGHVERTFVRPHADRLIVVNGSLVATANHPFYTSHGWIRAEALEVGDSLIRGRDVDPASGARFEVEPAQVHQLMMRPGSVTTYNLEIAVHHNYFAGGLLVGDGP